MGRTWEDDYRADTLPWDQGRVEPHLEAFVRDRPVAPCRVLEIGCGTGSDAVWLARMGFDVVAVDIAPTAIERAKARAAESGVSPRFLVHDILAEPLEHGPFGFVFDRGVFHTFAEAHERATFARRVADRLEPGGLWYSLIGSTEGPPRDTGPPRRSARDVVEAIEPSLEILSLARAGFHDDQVAAWTCLARRR